MTRRRNIAFGWALALPLAALFAALGAWQHGRAQEKQARLDQVEKVLQSRQAFLLATDTVRGGGYWWVEDEGRLESATLLLDNQRRNGRIGVNVYCILDLGATWGGGHRLVDFGWLPVPADRRMPDAFCPAGPFEVRGLELDLPSPGVAVGEALQPVDEGRWLMTRVDVDAIYAATGRVVRPTVVRLDPDLPVGFARDLNILPNTLPPERHLGYALQWWALSLAVLVVALVLTLRRPRAHRPTPE